VKIRKAVITAAAPSQRTLPLQTLVDRDGKTKTVLAVLVEEARRAGIEEICVVVHPGDEGAYQQASAVGHLCFIAQDAPQGYGHAVWCARQFIGNDPFLHMVGDHVFVDQGRAGCAQQLVEAAERHDCAAISGVQATRETQLHRFGTVGGLRVKGTSDLYRIERVIEKPTPTEAEQSLVVPGLRAGFYLCYFGIHVLPASVMGMLEPQVADRQERVSLSPVLAQLAEQERYLALEIQGQRYAIDAPYGLLTAQLALALSGPDRSEVLAGLCELLAQRAMRTGADE
jgi:UTP--glucose-1-phosphate uridylyltransferase